MELEKVDFMAVMTMRLCTVPVQVMLCSHRHRTVPVLGAYLVEAVHLYVVSVADLQKLRYSGIVAAKTSVQS